MNALNDHIDCANIALCSIPHIPSGVIASLYQIKRAPLLLDDVGIYQDAPEGRHSMGWISDLVTSARHPCAATACTTVPTDPKDNALSGSRKRKFLPSPCCLLQSCL